MDDSFARRSGTPAGAEPLAGRITVVTGASSGIGRAVALALAAQRATVCLVGRDRDRLADVARSAGLTSPRVLIQQADLSREDEVQQLAGRLRADVDVPPSVDKRGNCGHATIFGDGLVSDFENARSHA